MSYPLFVKPTRGSSYPAEYTSGDELSDSEAGSSDEEVMVKKGVLRGFRRRQEAAESEVERLEDECDELFQKARDGRDRDMLANAYMGARADHERVSREASMLQEQYRRAKKSGEGWEKTAGKWKEEARTLRAQNAALSRRLNEKNSKEAAVKRPEDVRTKGEDRSSKPLLKKMQALGFNASTPIGPNSVESKDKKRKRGFFEDLTFRSPAKVKGHEEYDIERKDVPGSHKKIRRGIKRT